MLVHVCNSLSERTKFPLALLLVFEIFLMSEIGTVASSPPTVSTDGVTKVQKAFGNHYGASLANTHFRAGNISRVERDSCLIDGCFCLLSILDLTDDCCGECTPIDEVLLYCTGGAGECIEKGKACTTDTKCCEDNDEVVTCKDGFCERECIKGGSKLPCASNDDCCDFGDTERGQCSSTSTDDKQCTTCTRPDNGCNNDNDQCCKDGKDSSECTQSEGAWKCKRCTELGQACSADDQCCGTNEGNYCRFQGESGACTSCISPDKECSATNDKCCEDGGAKYKCRRHPVVGKDICWKSQ